MKLYLVRHGEAEPREFRRHPFILVGECVAAFFAGLTALGCLAYESTALALLSGVVFLLVFAHCVWRLLTPAIRLTDRELICFPGLLGTPKAFELSEIRSVAQVALGGVELVLATGEKVKVPDASSLSEEKRAALMALLRRAIEERAKRRSERSL